MVDMRVTTPVNSVENDLWGLTSRLKLSKVLASKGGERLRSLVIGVTPLPPQEAMGGRPARLGPESQAKDSEGVFPLYLGQCSVLIIMQKYSRKKWRKNLSQTHMVKLGEEGESEDVYVTQSIWVPLGFWPGAGRARDQGRVGEQLSLSVGVTEELCQTAAEVSPLGRQSREVKPCWARGGPSVWGWW